MRDMGLYRHMLGVGVALPLAWCFAVSAQANPGDLDPSFGRRGKVITDFASGGSGDSATALAFQADGKVVAAGTSYTDTSSDFALARYNPDGTLDTTFGTNGKVR